MSKLQRIADYKAQWSKKTLKQVMKELESYQAYLARHPDRHFQQAAPDEMTDGDRIIALKDVIREKS